MNFQEHYQKIFFESLSQRRTSPTTTIIAEVMEVLNIKKGAAYKRMNGETAMTITEAVQIADHFQMSLDDIFKSNKYITFSHPFVSEEKTTIDVFLGQFKKFMQIIKEGHGKEGVEMSYLANELPVFYYFSHKYIFNFLLSVWRHLHWDDIPLSIDENKELNVQAEIFRKDTLDSYYKQNVTEIWNSNMLNNLYQQIIFCITIRGFKEASYVKLLVSDIENLLNELRAITMTGEKTIKGMQVPGSEIKIYLNDFGNYLNIVQYQSPQVSSSFIGYDFPQFIVSHNPSFYEFSNNWIGKLKKRSVLISSEGYQYRELFFIKMEKDFSYFKERVGKLMEIYYN